MSKKVTHLTGPCLNLKPTKWASIDSEISVPCLNTMSIDIQEISSQLVLQYMYNVNKY